MGWDNPMFFQMNTGTFLVFEGLDGAGKSTLIHKVKDYLTHNGKIVTLTREPGGTAIGEEVRKILLRTDAEVPVPKCELLLYEAIRAQHVERVIQPALKKGHWVLCDRFTASTVAFQAAGRSLEMSNIHWLNEFATSGLKPSLNILLDLSPHLSLDRQKIRTQATGQSADRFESEKIEFHERVRQGYLDFAKNDPENWCVVDATQNVDQSFKQLMNEFQRRAWA